MEKFDLYKDIRMRTNGEIYVGIVGPVRTGKSTFARKFIEHLALPALTDHAQSAARDEMPASASGKTITTVEPKFIPREAIRVPVGEEGEIAVRLVDCVGFLVPGAEGTEENGSPRMVKTPWQEEPLPFSEAARIGTQKVITDHATVGLVITTDGSFGELSRESFLDAEKQAILQLQQIGKPFFVIVNSTRPFSEEAKAAAAWISSAYAVHTIVLNCEQLGLNEIQQVFEEFLLEFPLKRVIFHIPKWVETLSQEHWLKQSLFQSVKNSMQGMRKLRDVTEPKSGFTLDNQYIKSVKTERTDLAEGSVEVNVSLPDALYYQVLSEMTGADISSEYQLISLVKEMSAKKKEYDTVAEAMSAVRQTGYGVISPGKDEIIMKEPEIVRHGNRYGVKVTAEAPSIHLLRADVMTEIAPIVGSEEQAKGLIAYIKENENTEEGAWSTLIFGKSIEQLVEEGIQTKLSSVGEECQMKLQNAMKRIVNESKGKIIFILL
ncbi:MAG: stage IV sporulation protein A [Lachnospiraceae bacterium]|nr:stage IV sporulation protein A [Lachnospiraceae bacterium]